VKVVILAGGLGTRLSEETSARPKPMVEIGERPILWHIMKSYSHYGFNDFVVCLGYKGYMIKEYFSNYFLHMSDVTFDMSDNSMQVHQNAAEPWRVTLVDTGPDTQTGGRIKRVGDHIGNDTFMLTYGDGVSDVPLDRLLSYHRSHGKLVTVTAVPAPARFGGIAFDGDQISGFAEKHAGGDGWINGGFMVMEPGVVDYLESDGDSLEIKLLERLGRNGELAAYKHAGFWQCMDTLRDKQALEQLWASDAPPWKRW
jgi:glucose-1-phosphate cytidylyltransferase